ncbi:hypothetical protein HC341_18290 [Aquisalimonas sp. 2447]|uniref:TAXI family TRAP transporter solute-binding subunit n=1 Tax=Aquisalimonas sp. 2447 TaxID=2740807 RepID=UPI0014326A70|nr:TAXI family TRAP transporter solute-binding subunit [Aquisalimonas sp. 2447]QIT56975.1 hypothetical protein HC341_18290 [Aquisalimonas sp. 2447]
MSHPARTRRNQCCAAVLGLCLPLAATQTAFADDFDWPGSIGIGTPGTDSGSFASANGWAPLLEEHTDSTVRVIPEDSEPTRYRRLTEREEFALVSTSMAEARFQIEGVNQYASTPLEPQEIVWHHNDTPWGFVVRGDSDLESIDDLKEEGVRVSVSSQSPPMIQAVEEALPAFLGMTPEEAEEKWEFVPAGSYAENCRSVTDGRADVAWCAPISGVLSEMQGHPEGIRFLDQPLDDDAAWERWLEVRPTHVPTEIDMGVSEAVGAEGLVSNFYYWTRADADADFIYNLARWFHEQHDEYKDTHPLSARMSLDLFMEYVRNSPMPVHEGTVRYLEEIGEWTDEDQARNQEARANMEDWLEAREEALMAAMERGIEPDHENEEFVELVEEHTDGLPTFRTQL